jgi:hypothetical protein
MLSSFLWPVIVFLDLRQRSPIGLLYHGIIQFKVKFTRYCQKNTSCSNFQWVQINMPEKAFRKKFEDILWFEDHQESEPLQG